MALEQVVVVGASAAGLTAAETLRREGFAGRLTVIGEETEQPYDRPPLSKQVLKGEWADERTVLRPAEALGALGATWLLGVRAAGLDVGAQQVELADGRRVAYDGLVIATGVTPRRLPFGHGLAGVHTLRTLADARALRADLAQWVDVAIIGAGFLGTETAAVARELGCRVTVIDPDEAPLQRQLGPLFARRFRNLHQGQGVDLRLGVGVVGLGGRDGRVASVQLSDGSQIAAHVVLVAVGSRPATGWLDSSGLSLGDGVVCDECCMAAPGIVAAGDVASWTHPALGRVRLEHRMNATEQGMAAARTLLGHRTPFAPIPYFWTDQYDVKVQVYGYVGEGEFDVVDGDPDGDSFVAVQRTATGSPQAVAGWNMPRQVRTLRAEVARGFDERLRETTR